MTDATYEVRTGFDEKFVMVPMPVLEANVSIGAKLLWITLRSYAWKGDSCYPSQKTIAGLLGCNVSSVRRYTRELEATEMLEVEVKRQGREITHTTYTLLLEGALNMSAGSAQSERRGPLNMSAEVDEEKQTNEVHGAEVIDVLMGEPTRLARMLSRMAKESRGVPHGSPQFNASKGSIESIEKLHRIDGVAYEEIEAFIGWLYTADSDRATFWRRNILSGDKLRKQFFRVRDEAVQEARQDTGGFLSYLSPEGRARFLGQQEGVR